MMLDAQRIAEQQELPALVNEAKIGLEAMVLALSDFRERLRDLEREVHRLREHCEGHCPLGHTRGQ